MTTDVGVRLSIADALGRLMKDEISFRFEAFDGSVAGPVDAPLTLRLLNERGLSYLMTAPGDLGFARAYVAGDLELDGTHPGDPYEAMALLMSQLRFKIPSAAEMLQIMRSLGFGTLKPPPPPAEEHLPKWRRALEGMRHNKRRDAEAIQHHYDVSNRFYELVLGPSMTYTCAVFPTRESTLEEAQHEKYDLIARKLDLKPGQRLLDVGCGWGGMVRHAAKHYGVKALGVTLSREQAAWAQEEIKRQGLEDLAEVRYGDYRDITEDGFDALSSIGMTEHIGVKQYDEYFSFLRSRIRVGGRLLNHCITRPNNKITSTGAFIDRYVFPDGELTGVGRITMAAQDAGLEVRHVENLREHYALTLKGWNDNLVKNWDEALEEVSLGRAKVWGLYMAGSRLAFERNEIELHHVLAVKPDRLGNADWPLRPTWLS
ncbi:class I SAM-dependent methyltransferase [Aeromicrobium wangtongii]|uniref:Cyclopropane-fatty-acyl-phospholipid synthase family protein n=1 Tax=Aeromicrobium wangtongii TaxID=2969247 RepID=A0ABY5M7E9_9ACTN|nr:class I SAM-dependent methyltransferase [Aeromicrobium wangtongii]MCD9199744.1 cyclopropane-fatty-acyl-phospholipid synthase family protein [Aeromicrobium wangtongii]UUP14093.1 cyclopropane-fatty-acyl-phospholipid synthase family protein [Aeromicrobium wangtongii]